MRAAPNEAAEMKLPFKRLPAGIKILIALAVILAAAVGNYSAFNSKSEKALMYDRLSDDLGAVRGSLTKLGYTLDMFIMTGRFENTTVTLIKSDVDRIDERINSIMSNRSFDPAIQGDALISEGLNSMINDWQTVKGEINRLNKASSRDEIILIHNSVDTNTILVNELSDRMLEVIDKAKDKSLREIKLQAIESSVGFVALCIAAYIIFYKKMISPVGKAASIARMIAEGNMNARFPSEHGGAVGRLGGSLNAMIGAIIERNYVMDRKTNALCEAVITKTAQIESLDALTKLAGKSLAQQEVFAGATKLIVDSGAADAAWLYITEGEKLVLKANSGIDDYYIREAPALKRAPKEEMGQLYHNIEDFPCREYADFFSSHGYRALVRVPVSYGMDFYGELYAVSREGRMFSADMVCYFEAVATHIGAFSGYTALFQKEHTSKKFLERLINQTPFGVAVFDRGGTCTLANNVLKRYLGAIQSFNFVGLYSLYEDDVLKESALTESIVRSYDGYTSQFVLEYDPALVTRYGFTGTKRKFRVKSVPLYDAGGEIPSIALFYEEIAGGEQAVING